MSIVTILNSFEQVKAFVAENFGTLTVNLKNTIEETNKEIRLLNQCFENLRSQISNKSFDEAFQMSINKQLTSLENLISDQLGYLEDINDICLTNLPEVLELNTIVKNNVLTSIQEFSEKIESYNLSSQINETKNEKGSLPRHISATFHKALQTKKRV